jgi:hypothetical protein
VGQLIIINAFTRQIETKKTLLILLPMDGPKGLVDLFLPYVSLSFPLLLTSDYNQTSAAADFSSLFLVSKFKLNCPFYKLVKKGFL